MQYKFKFGLLGKKVQMFSERQMGVVVEKEPDVVCVYGTDEDYHILCAVPLCHPKFLKGAEYTVEFDEKDCARICVGDFVKFRRIKSLKCYGSDAWGQDVQTEWLEG